MAAKIKRNLIIILVTFLIQFVSCQEISLANRVVGGEDAPEELAPHQASIRDETNQHYCGGAIINQYWILTAAHCVEGEDPRNISVVVGTNLRSGSGDRYQAATFIQHTGYQPESTNSTMNDIALIRVQTPIQFHDGVRAIRLVDRPTAAGANPVSITGWGRLSYEGERPDVLQVLSTTVISLEECRSELVNVSGVVNSHICTRNNEGQGSCSGDSGGPVVYDDTLIGIISWGFECARGAPDVHTSVLYFRNWITDNMRQGDAQFTRPSNSPNANLQNPNNNINNARGGTIQNSNIKPNPINSNTNNSPIKNAPINDFEDNNARTYSSGNGIKPYVAPTNNAPDSYVLNSNKGSNSYALAPKPNAAPKSNAPDNSYANYNSRPDPQSYNHDTLQYNGDNNYPYSNSQGKQQGYDDTYNDNRPNTMSFFSFPPFNMRSTSGPRNDYSIHHHPHRHTYISY